MRITRRIGPPARPAAGLALDVDALCLSFARRCREHGVRVTTQRLAVYRALAEDPSHPTADAIHRRLRGTMPSLSPATVYRVLESLEADGLLRRVSTMGGAARFDANLAPHQHLICRVCGRMTDVPRPALEVGRVAAGVRPRFVVEDVDVRIVGRCETCPPGPGGPPDPVRAAPRRATPASTHRVRSP
jgi:Fur family transcriptional regulator, peroxide stress response regulator